MNKILLSQNIIVKALKVLQQFSEEELIGFLSQEEINELPNVARNEMIKLVGIENALDR